MAAVEAPDIFVALRAHGAGGLVGGVVVDFGEDLVVDLRPLAAQDGQEGAPLQAGGLFDLQEFAEGGEDIELRDHGVADFAAAEDAGAAHDQRHAPAGIGEIALHAGEGDAVVGGADDERVGGEPVTFQSVEHDAHAVIEQARAGVESGHVAAGLRGVGQGDGRLQVARVVGGRGLGIFAMGLEEADVHEEGLGGVAGRNSAASGRDGGGAGVLGAQQFVEADFGGVAWRCAAVRRGRNDTRLCAACEAGGWSSR